MIVRLDAGNRCELPPRTTRWMRLRAWWRGFVKRYVVDDWYGDPY